MSITLRRSEERGLTRGGWLESRHTFSFGEYFDEEHHRFSNLRVINDDIIAPGAGFETHPHRDMEILTYVLEGAVAHRDSTGAEGVTRRGEIQRMTAGSGIAHSERNASETEPLHLLQIWITPNRKSLAPSYQERPIKWVAPWTTIAAPAEQDGIVAISADARLLASRPDAGSILAYEFAPLRAGWLHVARGAIRIGDAILVTGDGAAIQDQKSIEIRADQSSEILLFDLPEAR